MHQLWDTLRICITLLLAATAAVMTSTAAGRQDFKQALNDVLTAVANDVATDQPGKAYLVASHDGLSRDHAGD